MPMLNEDKYLNDQATTVSLADLEDCSLAIDATYWLSLLLDNEPAREPLLPALGGLTGIEAHINVMLDLFAENRIVPLFVFDGQSLTGQENVSLRRARAANERTNHAWQLYSDSHATEAVDTFGQNPGAYSVRSLYPLLQRELKNRSLHFIVAPYNACAQLGYFEMIDSDQVAAVMGPQELLAYPVKDHIIRTIDWEHKKMTALSKQKLLRQNGIGEATLIDAILMTGTSFLSPFPAMENDQVNPMSPSFQDAVNYLRTSQKDVAVVCSAFNDAVQARDPDWLDKYRKARLAVNHFIHIAESGEVRVNDYDRLTQNNHEYLGLQLPAELFHYLNTGLIGSRILNCITHGQILVQPTLDGQASNEYKKLVSSQIVPIKEQTLGLIVPRVHRGIAHKAITLRVWYDSNFAYTLNHSGLVPQPSADVGTWDVKEEDLPPGLYPAVAGPVGSAVCALQYEDFVPKTIAKNKHIKGIDSTTLVTSVAIFRFLHLRGYVNKDHSLNAWGHGLAATMISIGDVVDDEVQRDRLEQAALLAFELIKLGLLSNKPREERAGYPRKGSDEEKASLALISEVSSLLKLRHQAFGYTGPLNRSLLAFRSLSTTVRDADRDLIEAIIANMFMFAQSKRDRKDQVEISSRLPFSEEPDIGLGIAVRTFFDDDEISYDKETRAGKLAAFPETFVPHATHLVEDFRIAVDFFGVLNTGVQSMEGGLADGVKTAWAKAQAYLDARPF